MNENGVSRWIKRAFRETPWTAGIIAINLTTWLLIFFRVDFPRVLTGSLGVSTAWVWLSYPLVTLMPALWFAVSLYVFHWIASSLERRWGSEKFGRVFVVITLLSAVALWVGSAVDQQTFNPSVNMMFGFALPEITLFCIWGALNTEATVLFMFVVPVKAKYLAWGITILSYFSFGQFLGPVVPAFLLPLAAAGWFWARRPEAGRMGSVKKPRKSIGERFEERKRAKRKSRFKLVEGNSNPLPETKVPDLKSLNRDSKEREKSVDETELDRILDKIRFEGMAALTPEEKETLDSQSRKLNEQ
jgi:uncharacterized protein DUF6576